ncbi:bifunctional methylenetetrahydrofolate dehydrogenase/methenyltetrahydrofolate cyclohydrolase FolD [Pelagicoccus sp. SDUM812003]|uniref:bifunctional methylenetetrahydrofolate dehydrogenase/methenyltetrahydrofolate cyclohydrolase FolD n=1 Tax=Pelagicoccus sp. SDUM812003 TaxID=3041267 RepID=UPI00280EDC13|nr:bifunctional methylenetetrahydrofolate dehydrogenase/methenyltetrahydrofolate cyclohydrolase FolD [Pelagicoccus sp. SDUM812003]MDQ8202985.1 bifunctional methylenetetrahydrofolate dehydrogenase/methenyltetrahydrofolate cyclohydrolase FolD [Pelagicoccus sp. SDUM812003]
MKLIDGKQIAKDIVTELTEEVAKIEGPKPCIAFIRVGEDPASVSYVRSKNRTAEKIGIKPLLFELPESITQAELIKKVDELNADPEVHGILIQSPLPSQLDEQEAFNRIHPNKDVDGFHVQNAGRVVQEDPNGFASCTPAGIIEICQREGISLEGKHVVVIGRSLIVGKTFALLAMQKGPHANATVTVCHSRTRNLPEVVKSGDVVVAAIGRPNFVTADMVKEGAVVIDVGINRVEDPSKKNGYRLVGDVDFAAVEPLASRITPVPGGVGPMTVAMLMKNTFKAYKLQSSS